MFTRLWAKWKSSLKWKLVSIFAAIVFCNLLVIGYFVNQQVTIAIERDHIELSRLVLKQANLNLDRYLQDYHHFMQTLGMSPQLTAWTNLSTANKKTESIVPYWSIRREYILPFANSHPEIVSVMLYHVGGNETAYSPYHGIRSGYSMAEEYWLPTIPRVGDISYVAELSSTYVDIALQPMPVPLISLVKRYGYNGATYVKIDIKLTLLQRILNEINIGENKIGLIVDEHGMIVAHTQMEKFQSSLEPHIADRMAGSPRGAFLLPESKEIVIYEAIANTTWKSAIIVPYHEIAGNSIDTIRNVVLAIAAACLLVSAVLIVMVASSVTSRITKIRNTMKQTGQGQMSVSVPVEGQDEISHLAQSYNVMLEDLQQYVRRLAESKAMEHQSVLFSLQSQIDAHFLYNTLEIINSMAAKIQHEEIEQITVSLAHMFRYTANFRQTEVTVQHEIEHLRRYLQIIQVRYGAEFSYELEVDDACRTARCLKVILQPIAENAVKHSFEATGEALRLSIRIAMLQEKHVQVVVSDNGKGFDRQRLAELSRQLQSREMQYSKFQRIGLLNIHYRLTTRYNTPESGIIIANNSVGGALVQVTFPYQK
ncbi:sensor histidine kinase [Paenibacillus xerothermodurans]|uniref:HAMP domain-containing protein n=1 Tax=Paenibacillus xerothermodurans TaxID=1977292 RepID=A0A2W1NB79_PAEXE|nr:histidine kinase [Paenibacillus xerothermodurans]PZE21144.1 HAMP domain-containing protein [Paenibacillus xerothermodurans]